MAIMTHFQRRWYRNGRTPVRAHRPTDGGKPVAGGAKHGNLNRIVDRKGYVRK